MKYAKKLGESECGHVDACKGDLDRVFVLCIFCAILSMLLS